MFQTYYLSATLIHCYIVTPVGGAEWLPLWVRLNHLLTWFVQKHWFIQEEKHTATMLLRVYIATNAVFVFRLEYRFNWAEEKKQQNNLLYHD